MQSIVQPDTFVNLLTAVEILFTSICQLIMEHFLLIICCKTSDCALLDAKYQQLQSLLHTSLSTL